MAGRRRRRGAPTTTERRLRNREVHAAARRAQALTPTDEVGAAADTLRSALAGLPPRQTAVIAAHAVEALDELTDTARRVGTAVVTLRAAQEGRAGDRQVADALRELEALRPATTHRLGES